MAIEDLPLLSLSHLEASVETLTDITDSFDNFDWTILHGLFDQIKGGENEV